MAQQLMWLMNTHNPELPDGDRWFTVHPWYTLAEMKQWWQAFMVGKVIGEPQEVTSRFFPYKPIATLAQLKEHSMVGIYQAS